MEGHCILLLQRRHSSWGEYLPLVRTLTFEVLRYISGEVQIVGVQYMCSVGHQGVSSVGH